MKAMNFIVSNGALIFLLLVVGSDFASAGDGTLAHGAECKGAATTPETKCADPFKCGKKADSSDGGGTKADTFGSEATDAADEGFCVCNVAGSLFYHATGADAAAKCQGAAAPTVAPTVGTVEHAGDCDATTKHCKAPFKCHKTATPDPTGATGDGQGTGEATATGDSGKCICEGAAKYFHGGSDVATMCQATAKGGGSFVGTADHGAACDDVPTDAAKKCKGTMLMCVNQLCACPADKPTWKADTCEADAGCPDGQHKMQNGNCEACPDKTTYVAASMNCTMETTSDGATEESSTAGADGLVYEPTLLKLGVATMGSFLLLVWSSS